MNDAIDSLAFAMAWTVALLNPTREDTRMNTASPSPTHPSIETTTKSLVAAILTEITDRNGWCQEWAGFTTSTKAEIEADLTRIVREWLLPYSNLAKGAAMALLLRPETEAGYVRAIERCIELAAEARCAKGVLDGLAPYASGHRTAKPDDALPYDGAAREDERCGRHLLAAANWAVSRAIRMQAEAERHQKRHREREGYMDDLRKARGEVTAATITINDAHNLLTRLGVPRLPKPYHDSVLMRIEVLLAMREGGAPSVVSAAPAVVD